MLAGQQTADRSWERAQSERLRARARVCEAKRSRHRERCGGSRQARRAIRSEETIPRAEPLRVPVRRRRSIPAVFTTIGPFLKPSHIGV
ncbi:hypothetical protein GY45DRAFT_1069043 [Cubamyces sp. BRFM 1775]|nr:hypothetical protein GY45DRAFT_1069043 [Cubamyces sp. BRFM 1775]